MECGTECWDRILGQEGQQQPHPAASHGIFLPGVEGLELKELDRSCCRVHAWSQGQGMVPGWVLGTVLAVLEAHQSIGLELAAYSGCVFAQPPSLTCQFWLINLEAERDQLEVGLASL